MTPGGTPSNPINKDNSSSQSKPSDSAHHIPILVRPIVDALIAPFAQLPREADPAWIVDCTFGGGGHTDALLKELEKLPGGTKHRVLAIDQDPKALDRGRDRFKKEIAQGRLLLVHGHFSDAKTIISDRPVLGLLADLGFSSDQMDDLNRGLSFQSDGPLDMRLDPTRPNSAYDLLATSNERELERIFSEYGEERYSRRIATAIVSAQKKGQLPKTPKQLADLIKQTIPKAAAHESRIHPATRCFQAIRIAVNEELEELDQLLQDGIMAVQPGGRVAILSFHSLEDRKVKNVFRMPAKGETGPFRNLTPKPLIADETEVRANPRSRSAKLRIAQRLANGETVRERKKRYSS